MPAASTYGRDLAVRRSPTFAAVVILALAALEIGLVVASLRGWDELEPTTVDYATSAISIPLGVATAIGLLRRRLWGWALGVGQVPLWLLVQLVQVPFDDEPWSVAVAALGAAFLFEGGILALLNGRGVRAAIAPRPPDVGVLGNLPVEPVLTVGLALIVGGLALEVGWGWMVLMLWIGIVLVRRLRQRAGSTI